MSASSTNLSKETACRTIPSPLFKTHELPNEPSGGSYLELMFFDGAGVGAPQLVILIRP